MSAPPVASVLLVAHGACDWTLRALSALAEHTPEPHEVILVDNASVDGTPERVRAAHPEVRVVENAANAGFGPANNQAAALASAPVLVLLNTDALVQPGWLPALLGALDAPGTGAVVPMLLHLDGTLQEAGALLAADGTVIAHGDGADADDPAYRFPRAVDFGAAACMAVRADLFAQLGGFDDRYAPAYYEDADLCLRLRAAGWATRYAPAARVVHARYGSSSSERASELSERNRARFVERWGGALTARPASLADPHPATLLAARDAPADGRVLVLAASASAADELLAALLAARPGARVTLLSADPAAAAWLARGVEVADPGPAGARVWLAGRRWHADLVIAADPLDEADARALAATQPQAVVLDAPPSDVPAALAAGGMA